MQRALIVLGALILVVFLLLVLYRYSEAPDGPPSPDPYPDTTEPTPEYTEPLSPSPVSPDPEPNEYVQYDNAEVVQYHNTDTLPDTGGIKLWP